MSDDKPVVDAPAVPAKAPKGEVQVACALPSGLSVLLGGVPVTFNGANHHSAHMGFGLTSGIDSDAYDAWAAEMGPNFAPVKSGAIFARKSDITGAIAERAPDVKTGFEGLDPSNPAPGIKPDTAPTV